MAAEGRSRSSARSSTTHSGVAGDEQRGEPGVDVLLGDGDQAVAADEEEEPAEGRRAELRRR